MESGAAQDTDQVEFPPVYNGVDSWAARSTLLLRHQVAVAAGDPRRAVELALRGGGQDLTGLGLCLLGDQERAEEFARLPGQHADMLRSRGRLAALRGDHAVALMEFTAAESGFRAAGELVEEARTAE